MRHSILFKNGVEIGGGSPFHAMQNFADPETESDMFHEGMKQLKDTGEFEFVENNDVFRIEMVGSYRGVDWAAV